MNDTWYTSPISGIIENGVAFDRMLSTFLLVIFILLQLSFPFYFYVNRFNRERDKNTLVIPLIDHFYEMMKKTQAMFVFLYVTGFFLVVKAELKGNTKMVLAIFVGMIIVWMLCLCCLMIFTTVFKRLGLYCWVFSKKSNKEKERRDDFGASRN